MLIYCLHSVCMCVCACLCVEREREIHSISSATLENLDFTAPSNFVLEKVMVTILICLGASGSESICFL